MKAQSSIEFLAMVSLSALLLAGLYGVMAAKESQALEYQNQQVASQVGSYTSFQVEMALVQRDGYSRVFSVPESIGGRRYNVTIVNGSAVVRWGNQSVIRPSRYAGENLTVTTFKSNVFRVSNNNGEVSLVEQ